MEFKRRKKEKVYVKKFLLKTKKTKIMLNNMITGENTPSTFKD